ncbi:MAG: hypothetical protein CBC42_00230 [Betaproteobacteria bacterium TMED82]|nr:MAG: hypothetical protein CBC42_00230 [Betaproteobacteria bacterium TMED82]|tara:strand:+ start:1593 stop:2063 length:471 start_codon:yes stop_codon:yes gene_type:complete
MLKFFSVLSVIVFVTINNQGYCDDSTRESLIIKNPHAAAPRPGVRNIAIYIENIINNSSKDEVLQKVTSPVFSDLELHEMKIKGGLMQMRRVSLITIPAKSSISLASGGLHIMGLNIVKLDKDAKSFPATLHFETLGAIAIEVNIHHSFQTHNHSH